MISLLDIFFVILFYSLIIVIVVWIQIHIKKPPNITKKQKTRLNVSFAVSVPLSILLLCYFISVFTLLEWVIAGIIALIITIITLVKVTKGGEKLTPEEVAMSKDLQLEAKEDKIKIAKCRICGKLYNEYMRPWGSRMICSEECQRIWQEQLMEKSQKNLKKTQKNINICCILELLIGLIPLIILLVILL